MSQYSNVNSTKSANINYSLNQTRKSLFVPLIDDNFAFGSNMTDPIWNNAVRADDFEPFGAAAKKQTCTRSTIALFRTQTHLVIGWFLFLEQADRQYPAPDIPTSSPWHGDLVELHFGSIDPDPHLLQLAVGITGLRFDSSGENLWDSHVFETQEGWGGEIRIPANSLLITEGGICFNFCRCDMKKAVFYCWSPLAKRFHEVENFGELLFADYTTTALLRSGIQPEKLLDRSAFEKCRTSWEVPAQKVLHGPYLSNPDNSSLCISWETAGKVPAYLEYKIKDSSNESVRVNCSQLNGIMASENNHFVKLDNLKPDTVYQYELYSLTPVTDVPQSTGIIRCFKTAPLPEQDYAFFCVTDIHSNAAFLTAALETEEAQKSAFHLLLGDNLSHAAGREALYTGIIDPIVAVNQKQKSDKPVVFVRGNHEQLGIFAKEYFTVMHHPSGRSWYAFSYGCVFFIILDSGDDKPDGPGRPLFSNTQLLAEEKEFLKSITDTPEYKNAAYRIAFIHIPPLTEDDVQYDMIQPLADAETPLTVMLSGHWHDYVKVEKDTTSFAPSTACRVVQKLEKAASLPFTRIALSTENTLFCKVSEKALELDVLEFDQNGKFSLFDKIVFDR